MKQKKFLPLVAAGALTGTLLFGAVVITNAFGRLSVNPEASWDAAWYYTADTFYSFMDEQGVQGRRDYLILHLFDYLFLISYTTLFIQLIRRLVPKPTARRRRLILLPLAAGTLDLVEGIIIDLSILRFPAESPVVGTIAGIVTLLKMVAFTATMFAILGLLLWRRYYKRARFR